MESQQFMSPSKVADCCIVRGSLLCRLPPRGRPVSVGGNGFATKLWRQGWVCLFQTVALMSGVPLPRGNTLPSIPTGVAGKYFQTHSTNHPGRPPHWQKPRTGQMRVSLASVCPICCNLAAGFVLGCQRKSYTFGPKIVIPGPISLQNKWALRLKGFII